jgi:hypothetical protein
MIGGVGVRAAINDSLQHRADSLPGAVGVLGEQAAELLALLPGNSPGGVGPRNPDGDGAPEQLLDVCDRLPAGVAEVSRDRGSARDGGILAEHEDRPGVVGGVERAFMDRAVFEVDERIGRGTAPIDGVGVVLDQPELASVGELAGTARSIRLSSCPSSSSPGRNVYSLRPSSSCGPDEVPCDEARGDSDR